MIRKLMVFLVFLLSCLLNGQHGNSLVFQKKIDSLEKLERHYYDIGDYLASFKTRSDIVTLKTKFFPKNDISIMESKLNVVFSEVDVFNLKMAWEKLDEIIQIVEPNQTKYKPIYPKMLFAKAYLYSRENKHLLANESYGLFIKAARKDAEFVKTKTYVDCLLNMSYFYSGLGNIQKGIYYAKLGYQLSKTPPIENSLIELKAILAITNCSIFADAYEKSETYSAEGLKLIESLNKNSNHNIIKTKSYERELIFISVYASYRRQKDHNVTTLLKLDEDLKKAIRTFSNEKAILQDQQKLNLLLTSNERLFELAKRISWELYNKTNNASYIDEIISLHESYLYNKIRIRLKSKEIVFKDIPLKVLDREKELLKKLYFQYDSISLKDSSLKEKWSVFQDSLKNRYPKYHDLKYGSIIQPIGNIKNKLPEATTLVRYFYILDRLYVFVCNSKEKLIIELPFINIDPYLLKLENDCDFNFTGAILETLHNRLWAPFEDKITTKNVIIVPDRNLFNLSFEMLTPKRIHSYADLATNSLLAKYNLSYNYSLFLIDDGSKTLEFEDNFVAYAPGFDDKMKKSYMLAVTDSIKQDKSYLTLLPQPFSHDLVSKYTRLFDGSSFMNQEASKQLFSKTAKEHKIIHIGTHAEANNQNPELSRLVFAKSMKDTTLIDDNYLYTYEIYNQNLSSNLAILSACETGKPTYQPGEGMISLAHAFNYAGSESILTSLWKVDEQSSTQILEYFYEHLYEGKNKDEALRLAKLNYIKNAKGRTLQPQYWAGLVLMGNSSPIEISKGMPLWQWILIAASILLGIILLFKLKKK